ncbi:NUDIX domain-containing protein [Peribacillus frigoritolerans]|nr:NUDIX domain-containing protein [Peribacillus frigoritolerans]
MEQYESIEKTIIREVKEETGIISSVNGIIALGDLPSKVHNVYLAFFDGLYRRKSTGG